MEKIRSTIFQKPEITGRKRRPNVHSSAKMPSARARLYTGRRSPLQIPKFSTSQP